MANINYSMIISSLYNHSFLSYKTKLDLVENQFSRKFLGFLSYFLVVFPDY